MRLEDEQYLEKLAAWRRGELAATAAAAPPPAPQAMPAPPAAASAPAVERMPNPIMARLEAERMASQAATSSSEGWEGNQPVGKSMGFAMPFAGQAVSPSNHRPLPNNGGPAPGWKPATDLREEQGGPPRDDSNSYGANFGRMLGDVGEGIAKWDRDFDWGLGRPARDTVVDLARRTGEFSGGAINAVKGTAAAASQAAMGHGKTAADTYRNVGRDAQRALDEATLDRYDAEDLRRAEWDKSPTYQEQRATDRERLGESGSYMGTLDKVGDFAGQMAFDPLNAILPGGGAFKGAASMAGLPEAAMGAKAAWAESRAAATAAREAIPAWKARQRRGAVNIGDWRGPRAEAAPSVQQRTAGPPGAAAVPEAHFIPDEPLPAAAAPPYQPSPLRGVPRMAAGEAERQAAQFGVPVGDFVDAYRAAAQELGPEAAARGLAWNEARRDLGLAKLPPHERKAVNEMLASGDWETLNQFVVAKNPRQGLDSYVVEFGAQHPELGLGDDPQALFEFLRSGKPRMNSDSLAREAGDRIGAAKASADDPLSFDPAALERQKPPTADEAARAEAELWRFEGGNTLPVPKEQPPAKFVHQAELMPNWPAKPPKQPEAIIQGPVRKAGDQLALNPLQAFASAGGDKPMFYRDQVAEGMRRAKTWHEQVLARPAAELQGIYSNVLKNKAAVQELNSELPVPGTPWRVGRFQLAVDDSMAPLRRRFGSGDAAALRTPEAQALAEFNRREVIGKTGELAERMGVKTDSGETFQRVANGGRYLQQLHPSVRQWIGGPEGEAFAREIEAIHGVPAKEAMAQLQAAAGLVERTTALEHQRAIPWLPSSRLGANGKPMPVVNHIPQPTTLDPQGMLMRQLEGQYKRLATVGQFGQDMENVLLPSGDSLNLAQKLAKEAIQNGADGQEVVDKLRTMLGAYYGTPEGSLTKFRAGESSFWPLRFLANSTNPVAQVARSAGGALNHMALQMTGLKSLAQPLQEGFATVGVVNTLAGYAKAAGANVAELFTGENAMRKAAEAAGAVGRDHQLWRTRFADPRNMVESTIKSGASMLTLTGKINNFVQGWTEEALYDAGRAHATQMLKRGVTAAERRTMERFQMPEAFIRAMERPQGLAPQEREVLLQTYGREAAKWTQFRGLGGVDRGVVQNDQFLTAINKFAGYTYNTTKAFLENGNDIVQGIRTGDMKRAALGVRALMKRTAGYAISGEVTGDILAALRGDDIGTRGENSPLGPVMGRLFDNLMHAGYLGLGQTVMHFAAGRPNDGSQGFGVRPLGPALAPVAGLIEAGRTGDISKLGRELGPRRLPLWNNLGQGLGLLEKTDRRGNLLPKDTELPPLKMSGMPRRPSTGRKRNPYKTKDD